ncbi:MAG: glycosyltransferase family 4 protein [Geodermatophilaceae bacterium]
MIVLSHPFGNANVRAVLSALEDSELLAKYVTALGWSDRARWLQLLPAGIRAKWRAAPTPFLLLNCNYNQRAKSPDCWLAVHLSRSSWSSTSADGRASTRCGRAWIERRRRICVPTPRRKTFAAFMHTKIARSSRSVWRESSAFAASTICRSHTSRRLRSFCAKKPSAIRIGSQLLGGTRDSAEKLARKAEELELAEMVVCPSGFVLDSLPDKARTARECIVVPFGSPTVALADQARGEGPLRVLFAGAMTQRKGLADLFAAMELISRGDVELVVMGSLLRPLEWYRERCPCFTYAPPRPHAEVLRLMLSCDVFVLPSIVEGRALVQQEAMACGLPLIATKNAGGDDLIIERRNRIPHPDPLSSGTGRKNKLVRS